jgi:acylphosphatase
MAPMLVATAIPAAEARAIRVRGLVQGVGFPPTVWRLARDCGLAGDVWNDAEGIMIRAWGRPADLDRLLRRLEDQPPPLARIDSIAWALSEDGPIDGGFHIVSSLAGEWRGLGSIDHSGMRLRAAYARCDAERKFSVPALRIADPKSCQCGEVLKGIINPWECKVFGTACTPDSPLGALMVSSEGACAAYYQFGAIPRHKRTNVA